MDATSFSLVFECHVWSLYFDSIFTVFQTKKKRYQLKSLTFQTTKAVYDVSQPLDIQFSFSLNARYFWLQVRLHRVLYTIQLRKQFTKIWWCCESYRLIGQKPINTRFLTPFSLGRKCSEITLWNTWNFELQISWV